MEIIQYSYKPLIKSSRLSDRI